MFLLQKEAVFTKGLHTTRVTVGRIAVSMTVNVWTTTQGDIAVSRGKLNMLK